MIITDEVFDSLSWENVDGRQLDGLITGWTVFGAEPIDYPITNGAIIYLRDASGNLAALELGQEPGGDMFYISYAKIPSEAAKSKKSGRRRKADAEKRLTNNRSAKIAR